MTLVYSATNLKSKNGSAAKKSAGPSVRKREGWTSGPGNEFLPPKLTRVPQATVSCAWGFPSPVRFDSRFRILLNPQPTKVKIPARHNRWLGACPERKSKGGTLVCFDYSECLPGPPALSKPEGRVMTAQDDDMAVGGLLSPKGL